MSPRAMGFRVVGGSEGVREGREVLQELQRLQPCLSEQQCCHVEHGSQLAGA